MKKITQMFVAISIICLTGCTSSSVDLEQYLTTIFTVENEVFKTANIEPELIVDGNVGYYDFGEELVDVVDSVYGDYVTSDMLVDGHTFHANIVGLQLLPYSSDFTMEVVSIDLVEVDETQYDYEVVVNVTSYESDQLTLTGRIQIEDDVIISTTMNGFDLTKVINDTVEGQYTIEEVTYLSTLSSYSKEYYNDLMQGISIAFKDDFCIDDEVIYSSYTVVEQELSSDVSDLFENDYKAYSIVGQGNTEVEYGVVLEGEDLYFIEYFDMGVNSISLLK